MRSVVLWFFLAVAVAAAEYDDEPLEEVEEEDVDDPYSHLPDEEEDYYRRKRDIHEPYEEHIRVKRCCEDRVRRSADYVRTPRQVHQYEVHEFTDEHDPSSPPYEEMLAASADHYHSVYAAPGAPKTARYLNPDVTPAQFHVSSPVSPVLSSVSHEVPLPVASVPSVPLQQLDGDQSAAAARHLHQQKHGHGHSQGGGHGNHAKHHKEQGVKTTKGFNQDHYVDKGGKGHKTDELHRKEYEEALGKKKKHRDQAGHKGNHEEEAHGHRGAKFDEKKGHKKGHKTKEHHRFGKFNAKHAANESGKKKAHHVNAGHDYVEKGKKGYSNKGHVDADHKGHNGKKGHEEHHQHHSSHGKKGGKEGASQWGYAKKN
ncbi:Uncharacterized protein OBRU01_12459, partial [Operophtera brumata]